jgi:radical SAM protein with 4Fe4S-binding SPASM domain
MAEPYVSFARRDFFFNRFFDEAILYDRRAQDYVVFEGAIVDLLHLLYVESMRRSELPQRLAAVLSPRGLDGASLERAVQQLIGIGIAIETEDRERTRAIAPRHDAVEHVRALREAPYFYTPLAANLFINGRCNQTCEFCFLDFDKMRAEHQEMLSTEQWMDIVDRMVDAGVSIVNVGGMEPLISLDLTIAILARAKAAGCFVGFITNGSIPLSDAQLDRIAALGAKVGVSLEDHRAEVHNGAAGLPTAFRNCLRNVEQLAARGVEIGVQAVALRENTGTIEDFISWVDSLGVSTFAIQNVFGGPWCSRLDLFDKALRPGEYDAVLRRVLAMRDRVRLKIEYDAFPHQHETPGRHPSRAMAFRALTTCSAGKTAMQISPRGDFQPCPFTVGHSQHAIGNVMDTPFLDLWHDTPAFRDFRKARREDYGSAACQSCDHFESCRGGCLITAHAVKGDYLAGDPRCSKVDAAEPVRRRRFLPVAETSESR